MLATAFVLALSCTFFEMMLVINVEWIREFMIRFERIGLVISFFFSLGLGILFQAGGLIAMFGGILSTILSACIYQTHALELVDKWRANREVIVAKAQVIKVNVIGTVVLAYRLITAPFRFIMWAKRWIIIIIDGVKSAKRSVYQLVGK